MVYHEQSCHAFPDCFDRSAMHLIDGRSNTHIDLAESVIIALVVVK
jgi:hypothetical protein